MCLQLERGVSLKVLYTEFFIDNDVKYSKVQNVHVPLDICKYVKTLMLAENKFYLQKLSIFFDNK